MQKSIRTVLNSPVTVQQLNGNRAEMNNTQAEINRNRAEMDGNPVATHFGKALTRFGTVREPLDAAPKRFATGIIRFHTRIIR